jgi:HK97 gp10 family phage protein
LISFKLDGLEDLKGQIAGLEAEVAAKAIALAARRAFAPVLEAARALVPVDTGLTRDHIVIARQKGGDDGTVVRVGLKVKAFKGAAKLGRKTSSPHWRWRFIELGTVKMPAHPFLRPALDQNASEVLAILREELAKSIARALRRQHKGKR